MRQTEETRHRNLLVAVTICQGKGAAVTAIAHQKLNRRNTVHLCISAILQLCNSRLSLTLIRMGKIVFQQFLTHCFPVSTGKCARARCLLIPGKIFCGKLHLLFLLPAQV